MRRLRYVQRHLKDRVHPPFDVKIVSRHGPTANCRKSWKNCSTAKTKARARMARPFLQPSCASLLRFEKVQVARESDASAAPNHALQRTRPSCYGCHPHGPRTGSLSLDASKALLHCFRTPCFPSRQVFLGSSYLWHDPSFGEFPTDLLRSRFQDHIERRFCGTADPRKSTLRENVSQAPLAGLRFKGKADFLTERTRSA